MTNNSAPDPREQEDCPSGEVCDWDCDQHLVAHVPDVGVRPVVEGERAVAKLLAAFIREHEWRKDADARLIRARRWIETCVDPVVVGGTRKRAMLAFLDGAPDATDDMDSLPTASDDARVLEEAQGEIARLLAAWKASAQVAQQHLTRLVEAEQTLEKVRALADDDQRPPPPYTYAWIREQLRAILDSSAQGNDGEEA